MGVKGQGSRPTRKALVPAFVAAGALGRQLHQFQSHLAHTRVNKADLPGHAIGYINFTALLIRTTVINAHNFKLPIPGIHNTNPGSKWKARVSCRQALRVKVLSVGRLPALKLRPYQLALPTQTLIGLIGLLRCATNGASMTGAIRNISGTHRIAAQVMKSGRLIVCSFSYEL